jgi:hypothetical protein
VSVSQDAFARAILSPEAAVPQGLSDPDGRPAGRRFNVYRNNVVVSLTEALATAFPVIEKLVGTTNFKTLAGAYVRAHPPLSPLMMFYGADMPGFLEGFEPAQSLGYLPDVARLELALRRAYHAADAAPIAPEALGALAPDQLMAAELTLAPALQLVASPWPIHAIWTFNTHPGAPKPVMAAEDVLVTRPAYDPDVTRLPAGAAAFLAALADDRPLGDAAEAGAAATPDFDLGQTLALLLSQNAITDIKVPA